MTENEGTATFDARVNETDSFEVETGKAKNDDVSPAAVVSSRCSLKILGVLVVIALILISVIVGVASYAAGGNSVKNAQTELAQHSGAPTKLAQPSGVSTKSAQLAGAEEYSGANDPNGCRIRRRANVNEDPQLGTANSGTDYLAVGCFRTQDSPERHAMTTSDSWRQQAEDCGSVYITRFFGVSDSTCYCYVDAPQDRISIGSCDPINTCDSQRMEVYFKTNFNSICNQETTSKVRNFLVEEDDAPFGFDIVVNQFRPSPFELYKDECGTNIYEVQTEISQGNSQLSTSVKDIEEFARNRRSHISESISAGVSGGFDFGMFGASVAVSGSADIKQTHIFNSSGATYDGGKVLTSLGVKRVAEVKLADFDNKHSFVTLNEQFGNLLRQYHTGRYDRAVARQIYKKYGMFVVTRGIFGGYMQLRSTMSESSISSLFKQEDDYRQCYEVAMETEAKGFGFSAGVSASTGECNDEAKQKMQSSQNNYADESSEETVIGGKVEGGKFVVNAEFSTLLTSRDKYPSGDKGLELRPLSDFLSSRVISPLTVKTFQIDESGFDEIQAHLQMHMKEERSGVQSVIDQCGGCDVPYLVSGPTQDEYICTCYDPEVYIPPTENPSPYPTLYPMPYPTPYPTPHPTPWTDALGDFRKEECRFLASLPDKTVVIDTSSWVHKMDGIHEVAYARTCTPTPYPHPILKYSFAAKVKALKKLGITPLFVFDGKPTNVKLRENERHTRVSKSSQSNADTDEMIRQWSQRAHNERKLVLPPSMVLQPAKWLGFDVLDELELGDVYDDWSRDYTPKLRTLLEVNDNYIDKHFGTESAQYECVSAFQLLNGGNLGVKSIKVRNVRSGLRPNTNLLEFGFDWLSSERSIVHRV